MKKKYLFLKQSNIYDPINDENIKEHCIDLYISLKIVKRNF